MSITNVAIKRPHTTIMFYLAVVVISAVSLARLPIDLMPDVTFPSISVVVDYPGAAPEEIETLIARPVEEAIGSVSDVDRIDTYCQEERAVVRVRFQWGTDLDEIANDMRQRLDRIRDSMPDDARQPVLYKYDFNMSPIIRYGVAADMTSRELRYLVEDTLQPRLERVPGVAAVDIVGGNRREIQVNLAAEKLDSLNIPAQLVVDKIREENLDLPAGEITQGDINLLVRTYGQFKSIEEIEQVVLATRDEVPIYVRDVATVVDGIEELRQVMRINGQDAISLRVVKQATFNTVEVADNVNAEIEKIQQEMPHLNIATLWDSSDFIKDAISGVQNAATFGATLAVVILLVFLRNLRSTFIIACSIPVAVMASFSLIYFSGFTLNIVSFGGLALGIGLLVDSSIVVLENIFRHREAGESPHEAARKGTQEVSLAILASTLTTVVVFVPLLFLSGPSRIMFGQLSYIVAFSLVCSLAVALTLIPMLSARLLRLDNHDGKSIIHVLFRASEALFLRIDNAYRSVLHFALARRGLVVFASIALFLFALPFARVIPFEYMPSADEGEVDVYGKMAPGTRLEAMDEAFTKLEAIVVDSMGNQIKHRETSFGSTNWWRGGGGNNGEIELALKDIDERSMTSEEIAAELRKVVSQVPGMQLRTRPSGGLFIFRILQGDDSIAIDIRGHDQEQAAYIAKQVKDIVETIPGISDAYMAEDDSRPDMGIEIDREKAAEFGLTVSQIARTLRIKYGGQDATMFREEGDEFFVKVRLAEEDRIDADTVEGLWVTTPEGQRVAVSNFIRPKRGTGPTSINRVDKERSLSVAASLEPDYALGNVMAEVQERLAAVKLPEGFTLTYGGEYEDQQESYRQLAMGLILALILIYMVMCAQFESLIHPLIIMFAIPFALIGVIAAMVWTDTTLNIQSILGMTMLAGIAVNNAIVLVDYINMLRRERGMSLAQAIEEGGRHRLRPIFMTTGTTLLALSPMALGIGAGGELQAPMARVVIGGLFTSTVITLVFVPVLYSIVEELFEKRKTPAKPHDATPPSEAIPAK